MRLTLYDDDTRVKRSCVSCLHEKKRNQVIYNEKVYRYLTIIAILAVFLCVVFYELLRDLHCI